MHTVLSAEGQRTHIEIDEFGTINWLSIKDRYQQRVSVSVYKLFNQKCPFYMSGIYTPADNYYNETRNSYNKLSQPLCKTNARQNSLSYFGPSYWNKLPKMSGTVNTSKHKVKQFCFNQIKEKGYNLLN